jgi:predicted DNA-binding protein YlxM (UPF0122 family)
LQLGVPFSKGIDELSKEYSRRKTRLEASPFFQTLSNKQRKNLLNGHDSKFLTQSEIADRAGVSRKYLATCYKYCSNFIHTSPMAVAMMNTFRAGTPVGLERFKYVSELATAFMALTIRDFVRVVPDQREQVEGATWDIIQLRDGVLRNWERNSNDGDQPK